MAQRRPRHNRHGPPIIPPRYSLQVLIWAVVGFLVLIGLMVVLSILPGNSSRSSNKATRAAAAAAASFSQQQHQHRLFTSPNDIPSSILSSLDAILVLGGGVPKSVDRPPVYVERRCDDALAVVGRHLQESSSNKRLSTSATPLPILCLSAGTAHLPQLMGADGLPVWESTACAAYLENHAQQQEVQQPIHIFVETTSYDTIGNAYYTRVSHTDINGWKNLLVITNEFHMDRTMAIFDWIFGATDGSGSSSPGVRRRQQGYRLFFLASPNVGLTNQAIEARKEREAQSAATVRTQLAPKYKSLTQIHHFLTHEHALYSAHSLVERGRGISSSRITNNDKGASWAVKQSYGGTSSRDSNPA